MYDSYLRRVLVRRKKRWYYVNLFNKHNKETAGFYPCTVIFI